MIRRLLLALLALTLAVPALASGPGRLRMGVPSAINGLIVQSLAIGTTPYGSWAPTDPAALGIPTQGNPGDFGYDTRAIAGWATPAQFNTLRGSDGTLYLCVLAAKAPSVANFAAHGWRGIKEVWFGGNNPATWTKVHDVAIDPSNTANEDCYLTKVKAADVSTSQIVEVRAIAIPWVGQPFVLQGIIDPKTANYGQASGFARTNASPNMWSLQINLDPENVFPRVQVYKAASGGSNSNTCLTAGDPCATWDGALAKIRSYYTANYASSPFYVANDVGGATIYLTSSQAHTYGSEQATPPIVATATQWLKVTHAPGLTRADVRLTSMNNSGYGLRAEKLWLDGVTKTISLANNTPGGGQTTTYFSTRATDVYHDGSVTTALGSGSGSCPALPDPNFMDTGNGFNEVVNSEVHRAKATGFVNNTLLENVLIDTLSESGDAMANIKVVTDVTIKNMLDAPGCNHPDGLQIAGGGSMRLVYDFDFDYVGGSNSAQAIFWDDDYISYDLAFVRPRIRQNSQNHAYQFTKAPWNVYHYDPRIIGSYPNVGWWLTIINNRPDVRFNTVVPIAKDNRVVMLPGSVYPKISSTFLYGQSILYAGITTQEPLVSQPADDDTITRLGINAIAVWDADRLQSVNSDTVTGVFYQWRNANDTITFTNANSRTWRTWTLGDAARPVTVNPTGLNGHQTVEFQPVLGVGQPLVFNGTPGYIDCLKTPGKPCTAQPATTTTAANHAIEVFMLIRQDEDGAVLGTKNRILFGYGGSTSFRYLMLTNNGGEATFKAQVRSSAGTEESGLAPGVAEGTALAHLIYDGTNLCIGIYNASQKTYVAPSFGGVNARYACHVMTGTVNTNNGSGSSGRTVMSTPVTGPGGATGNYFDGGLNKLIVVDRVLTDAERTAEINALVARAGW